MNKHFPFLLAIAITVFASCSRKSASSEILDELNHALNLKDSYEAYFKNKVEVLKQLRREDTGLTHLYDIQRKLAEEYAAYSLDSTVHYLTENIRIAEEIGDDLRKAETELLLAQEYIMTGYHIEASDILEKYRNASVPTELKLLYFNVYHTFSGELMAYYQNKSEQDDIFARWRDSRDSLLHYAEPKSFLYYQIKSEEARDRGDEILRKTYLDSLIAVSPENSHDFAKACYFYAESVNEQDEKIFWLAKSAIADVMCSTKDYASLNDLSKLLFGAGEIDRAFQYTADYCLPDAFSFNGKLRPWQIVRFFPELEKAYAEKSKHQSRIMWAMIAGTSTLLALLVLVTIVLVMRQRILVHTREKLQESNSEIERRNAELESINSRLQQLNESLKETDKVKQEYIALFLGILSENINETRQYKNHVLKYIRRGNEKYLADEIEALPPIDEDIQHFYKMFDETFINLYPNFVEKFNALLSEGEAILPKGNDILTPELRIFALIKLGISDSSKIASLLHYSSNTIYNYRAKIKNKARCDRECFEEAVRAIV